MARTAKTSLAIYDDGIYLGDASSLDFAGSGVTGSYNSTTGRVTETITGGGGSGDTSVFGEIVSGSGTSFTLANTPIGGIDLSANGQVLLEGIGNDYTISGASITMANSWSSGSVIANYKY